MEEQPSMRDEPIRRSRSKARKNIHLMKSAGKLQFEPLDPCVKRRQTRYRGASLHLFTSKERSLERDDSSDGRCITSNDNYENKNLTNTSKSVASISSGALTFIWADGVQATSFLVTTPKYGGILVWDGGKDCTLVNVWRRGQIKQT